MDTAPTTESLYTAYQSNPTPEALHGVVKSLQPTIDYALGAVNAGDDPLVRSKAHLFAAKAIQKYDPTQGASLATHVSHQLKQLSRTARQSRSPVVIPERVQLDAWNLDQARKAYQEEHGHEPDLVQLADATGMPVTRLETINKYAMSMPSEEAFGGELESGTPDFAREALSAIHTDADHTDRRILELKLGYGGHKQLSPQEVAERLNLTPSQLSRRSMRLAKRIHDYQTALETT